MLRMKLFPRNEEPTNSNFHFDHPQTQIGHKYAILVRAVIPSRVECQFQRFADPFKSQGLQIPLGDPGAFVAEQQLDMAQVNTLPPQLRCE